MKTVVLALKATYLHATNPDLDIAVTFNTQALKDQFIGVQYSLSFTCFATRSYSTEGKEQSSVDTKKNWQTKLLQPKTPLV